MRGLLARCPMDAEAWRVRCDEALDLRKQRSRVGVEAVGMKRRRACKVIRLGKPAGFPRGLHVAGPLIAEGTEPRYRGIPPASRHGMTMPVDRHAEGRHPPPEAQNVAGRRVVGDGSE